nr:hypothetical transcript [Hymenolepis microstoma]CUU98140.1 hypothetical transcript [Hymenolepis microstoma]CUU98398.1 hypothetical transcript [Hymenolepis microstoma]
MTLSKDVILLSNSQSKFARSESSGIRKMSNQQNPSIQPPKTEATKCSFSFGVSQGVNVNSFSPIKRCPPPSPNALAKSSTSTNESIKGPIKYNEDTGEYKLIREIVKRIGMLMHRLNGSSVVVYTPNGSQ